MKNNLCILCDDKSTIKGNLLAKNFPIHAFKKHGSNSLDRFFYNLPVLIPFLLFSSICFTQPVLRWAKQISTANNGTIHSVIVDSSGNAYTTGFFSGTADFNSGPNTYPLVAAGENDIFIYKLDAGGNFLWAKQIGGFYNDIGYGITVDQSGNVYLTGHFGGTVDFDPGPGIYNLTATGKEDMFIAKLDSAGNFVWTKRIGSTESDISYAIALDKAGNVFATGGFSGTVDFDPGVNTYPLTSAGDENIFVCKLDSAGSFIWAKQMGGRSVSSGKSIFIDDSGLVYITGTFKGSADFDPGPGYYGLVAYGSTAGFSPYADVFISKLDTSGIFIWAKQAGGPNEDWSSAILVDGFGNVYTAGCIQNTDQCNFIQKLDASGNIVWFKQWGNGLGQVGLAVDAIQNVYSTGHFWNTVDFDPGPGIYNLTATGTGADIFISKFNAAGNFIWTQQTGSTGSDAGNEITIDVHGNLYTTGSFSDTVDFDPGPGIYTLAAGVTSSPYIGKLSDPASLPLTLLLFGGTVNPDASDLSWQTAQEKNTFVFEIERSGNGNDFSRIGSVAASGNSSFVKKYSFADAQPLAGVSYYRLKMVETDGSFTYSHVVALRRNMMTKALQLFPVPVNDELHVKATGNGMATVQLIDARGRLLRQEYRQLNGNTSLSIDVQALPNGIYFLLVQVQQERMVQRFLKHR